MIIKEIFEAPQWNRSEIARYARADDSDERISVLIESCIIESEPLLEYRVCYMIDNIVRTDHSIKFCGIDTPSSLIKKAVSGCENILLFAATIGAQFDRLIAKYSRLEPSKALILQAIGAERIESLCDAFCEKMNTELHPSKKSLRPRVSPGYGDIELKMQQEIFRVLDCERKIGLTLNESLLMSPSKSVTAMAGIGAYRCLEHNKCDSCTSTGCSYRK